MGTQHQHRDLKIQKRYKRRLVRAVPVSGAPLQHSVREISYAETHCSRLVLEALSCDVWSGCCCCCFAPFASRGSKHNDMMIL